MAATGKMPSITTIDREHYTKPLLLDMSDVEAVAGPSSPPRSPKLPPLLSASLYPPPPPSYQHFNPLNLHFHSILTQHWPAPGSEQEEALYSDERSIVDEPEGWTPRLKLQRRILLTHASGLDSLPDSVRSLHPELTSDEEIRNAVVSLGRLDLKLEMDPPDLEVLKSEKVGGYMVFGQWWPIPPKEGGLEEAGVRKLYDDETLDGNGRIGELIATGLNKHASSHAHIDTTVHALQIDDQPFFCFFVPS